MARMPTIALLLPLLMFGGSSVCDSATGKTPVEMEMDIAGGIAQPVQSSFEHLQNGRGVKKQKVLAKRMKFSNLHAAKRRSISPPAHEQDSRGNEPSIVGLTYTEHSTTTRGAPEVGFVCAPCPNDGPAQSLRPPPALLPQYAAKHRGNLTFEEMSHSHLQNTVSDIAGMIKTVGGDGPHKNQRIATVVRELLRHSELMQALGESDMATEIHRSIADGVRLQLCIMRNNSVHTDKIGRLIHNELMEAATCNLHTLPHGSQRLLAETLGCDVSSVDRALR